MQFRFKLYLIIILLCASMRIYEKDSEGFVLCMLVLPMCFLGKKEDNG